MSRSETENHVYSQATQREGTSNTTSVVPTKYLNIFVYFRSLHHNVQIVQGKKIINVLLTIKQFTKLSKSIWLLTNFALMIVLVLNWYKEVFKRFGEEGGQANGRGENKVYSPILQRAGQKGSNVGEGNNILWFTSIILCCSWLEALERSNYAIILKIVSFIFQCNVLCTHTVKPKFSRISQMPS